MKQSAALLFIAIIALYSNLNATAGPQTNPPPDISRVGIRPIGNWQVDAAETQELNQLFATALSAANSIPPTSNSGALRRAVNDELRAELETFLSEHPDSAYGPGVHSWLGRQAQQVCGYSLAINHFRKAFEVASASPDPSAIDIALEAGAALAKLLALTGQISELNALEAQALQIRAGRPLGGEWTWAREMRAWVTKHPSEAYKCGLYCLD